MSTPNDHYFTARPASADERTIRDIRLAGRDLSIATAPGVFSAGRLDTGTGVLLRSVPPLDVPDNSAVLDLGCGWGPVALSMAFELDAAAIPGVTVWGVDVNERAVDLLRQNAARLRLSTICGATPDDVPPDLRFAAIWSNPPVRIGKDALHALLHRWLSRLMPGGSAHLVVGKNLGGDSLHRWLAEEFADRASVERLASAKGFRVLTVTADD